jgi:transposase
MFALTSSFRYYLYRQPCDMRKSFDGLCGLVRTEFGAQPTSGDVYIFLNKRRTHVKLLRWEAGGFVLYYKRLESGTFTAPLRGSDPRISWHELVAMIEGIRVQKMTRAKRFQLEKIE